jgi:hypothetical protein
LKLRDTRGRCIGVVLRVLDFDIPLGGSHFAAARR